MTRHKKRFRVPIFWKILGSCLALSGLILLGSYLYAQHKIRKRMTGPELDEQFARYLMVQEDLGRTVGTVAEVISQDESIRDELAAISGTPEADQPMTPDQASHELMDELAGYDRALSAQSSLMPDVFIVFDANGKELYEGKSSPIHADDLRLLDPVLRVKSGGALYNKTLLHNGHVLQVTAIPINRPHHDTVVGGVLIGVATERYFMEYMHQSDAHERHQQKLTLVRNGEVLASTFDQSRWQDLAAALKPEKRQHAKDGDHPGQQVAFTDGDDKLWDVYEAPAEGMSGQSSSSNLGTYYIMEARDVRSRLEGISLVAVLVGIGGALVVAGALAMWITSPVKQFISATKAIADGEGDLTKRIDVDCNDELGDLADNLNKLFDNLYTLAHDVQGASFQVGASSAEISAASKQMLEGVKDQAVKIEGSTAAVTELSSSIQQVASNAMEATKVAEQSNTAVSSAMESMQQIRRTVESAADKIQDLGESGKRIGNIVEVIRQISEQTSLLALNASIEAAHAGEQGRGFAVVADEVSSLAKRVGQSAKDIEDLIATIKDQTADAVRAMQTGTREVEAGTGMVTGTLANLKQIIEVIQDTANAVQEQAIVSDEIARNMDAVQKIAGEVLASSEEAVVQGEQLHGLAYQLEESVRGFNLDGTPVAPTPETNGKEVATAAPAPRSLPPARKPAEPAAAKAATGGTKPRTRA
jgi:methyl-accepting chemotaxis protein